ncbi:hypothetical protein UYO_3135, partial [Lachnospiraceae bacterium JC7]
MNFYELVDEIIASNLECHWDNLPYSFNQSNRAKLKETFDLEAFDVVEKAYTIKIRFSSDRSDDDEKKEYRKYGDSELFPFTETELKVLNNLDWARLPHNLKAHIYDAIWLCNHMYEAAKTAVEEYYELYHEWFDEENWVQCVDYISRAIELAAKIGIKDKKDGFLTEIYNDVVKLNGNDPSFLSISLIELIICQNYYCDFNALIPFVDKLIKKNEGSINTAHILEHAYYVKANIYKKLKDTTSANKVYVGYADTLMQEAEKLVKVSGDENSIGNRNWFMAENDIKKAIELYQNNGAPEKAIGAQKRLVEVQRIAVKHMPMHEFKYDVTVFYKRFREEFENHDVHDLIWD